MATTKRPKLTDDKIVAMIDYAVGQSVGFSESKLSKERERVQLYYDGRRPEKAHPGDSGYQSLDVYDGVEDMKAQLLDVFSANKRPVVFDAAYGEDPAAAKVRTDYVTDVLFNQNEGYQLFHDTIEEGLMDRNAVVKLWWQKDIRDEYVEMAQTSVEEIQAYLSQHPEADLKEVEMDDVDGVTVKRATLKIKKDASQVRIGLLAGEEFGISPMAESIKKADFVYDRHEMTVDELIKAGYDKDDIKDLQSNDRLWLAMDPEKIARFQPTDDLIGTKVNEDGQNAKRVIMVYECYMELDLDDDGDGEGTGPLQLYKVVKAGNKVLDKEPVSHKPYIDFCPLPRAKAFWGQNYAKLLIPTQNARTYLTRSIINHALTTNNPRLQVVKGAVLNPRELMENRFGGIVNVTRPDGILPLPQTGLNPFVFQTIEMLKANKEELTGISDLSQGLNKDAVSKQNSGDMIHELITVSQLRQKIVARNFAERFLRPLYSEIYRLVLENEDRQKIIKVAGNWVPVDFAQWPEDTTMSVSFALGYGEQEKESLKWMNIGKALQGDPMLAQWYTPQEHHYVAQRALEAAGVTDMSSVLRPLKEAVQPPPNPLQQAEIAMKQADAAAKQATAQASTKNLELQMRKLELDHKEAMAKINLETLKVQSHLNLQEAQLQHKIAVDAAEIQLQKEAQEQDKLQAEAMPTR
jgi:hypothetical protein